MTDERLYSEAEIASIFQQAARAQEAARQRVEHTDGLTLAELQAIGREAGLAPEFVARAAAAAGHHRPVRRTTAGVPLRVEHAVGLPAPLTDDGWERLVGDLRETFGAVGHERREGALREWRNGNLHVYLAPSDEGDTLRMQTRSERFQTGLLGGSAFFGMGLVFLLILAASGDLGVALDKTMFVSLFAVVGLAVLAASAVGAARWAEMRSGQMEALAERAWVLAAGTDAAGAEPELVDGHRALDEPPAVMLDDAEPAPRGESLASSGRPHRRAGFARGGS